MSHNIDLDFIYKADQRGALSPGLSNGTLCRDLEYA